MSNNQTRGLLDGPRRVAGVASRRLNQHCLRMRADTAYRDAVNKLLEDLAARPDQIGKAARLLAPGHALLVQVVP